MDARGDGSCPHLVIPPIADIRLLAAANAGLGSGGYRLA
jgi:hypothetical protein